MFRWLVLSLLLSAGAVSLVYLVTGPNRWNPHVQEGGGLTPSVHAEDRDHASPTPAPPASGSQAPAVEPPSSRPLPDLKEFSLPVQGDRRDAIVIPGGNLVIAQQQEVAAERDGRIIFIGVEVPPDTVLPEGKEILPAPRIGFLAIKVAPDDPNTDDPRYRLPNDSHVYRAWKEGDPLHPGDIIVAHRPARIRRLEVGMRVKQGDLVALINQDVAYDELATKVQALNAASAEQASLVAARDAARASLDSAEASARSLKNSVSPEELRKARLEWVKATQEEKVKSALVVKAQREINAALTTLNMHEVRARIPGVVKAVYKNHEGDAVKALEPLLQIQNPGRLRIEAKLEIQDAHKLDAGMEAIVEATRPEPPRLVLGGHLEAITCVAVSKGPRSVIVSGSEDRTLLGWDAQSGAVLFKQDLLSVPRAIACSPPGSEDNLVLFGCNDGTVRLLDLKNKEKRELSGRHVGPVNCVAFSRDGKTCATGGDDLYIRLWETASGKLLSHVTAHQNAVTSLQFASDAQLVSAGRDGRLVVWNIDPDRHLLVRSLAIDGRSGDVPQLGVDPEGKHVLYDQGKELRVLSLESRQIQGTLQNPTGSSNFSTMALFAPDGKTILTNGGGAGRLQLWRAPSVQGRASELRQLIWNTGAATCGAFAPEGATGPEGSAFAVTGTQDHHVLLWALPSKKEVEERLTARLLLVEKQLDSRSREVRVWGELNNPGWLIPGGLATMVVPLSQKPR
jgi:WD40 repeat protein